MQILSRLGGSSSVDCVPHFSGSGILLFVFYEALLITPFQSDYGSAKVSVWKDWLRHPQNFWVRRALFQIHLWAGIGLGVYILVVSLSGCILIYRNSIIPQSRTLTIKGQRMTADQLK